MDQNNNKVNTSNVVVTNPVTSANQVSNPVAAVAVQPQPVQQTVPTTPTESVQQTTPVAQPTTSVEPAQTPVVETTPVVEAPKTVASPVIAPVDIKEEVEEVIDEQQQMIDNNKKMISSSPQSVDSSSIDVSHKDSDLKSESNVVSETVIDTDLNKVVEEPKEEVQNTLEEVSLTVDSTSLDLTAEENDPNSIFNRVEETNKKEVAPTKIGEEKHRFPFFMVLLFILLIVAAFNIDYLMGLVNEYILNVPTEEEQVKKEDKKDDGNKKNAYILDTPVDIGDVYKKLDNSKILNEFEASKNVEVTLNYDETNKKISFTTSNYLNIEGETSLTITYTGDDDHLGTECDSSNRDFCLVTTKALVMAFAEVEGVVTDDYEEVLDEYINNPLSDDLKKAIWGITYGESGFEDTGYTYTYSISLTYKVVVL